MRLSSWPHAQRHQLVAEHEWVEIALAKQVDGKDERAKKKNEEEDRESGSANLLPRGKGHHLQLMTDLFQE